MASVTKASAVVCESSVLRPGCSRADMQNDWSEAMETFTENPWLAAV